MSRGMILEKKIAIGLYLIAEATCCQYVSITYNYRSRTHLLSLNNYDPVRNVNIKRVVGKRWKAYWSLVAYLCTIFFKIENPYNTSVLGEISVHFTSISEEKKLRLYVIFFPLAVKNIPITNRTLFGVSRRWMLAVFLLSNEHQK